MKNLYSLCMIVDYVIEEEVTWRYCDGGTKASLSPLDGEIPPLDFENASLLRKHALVHLENTNDDESNDCFAIFKRCHKKHQLPPSDNQSLLRGWSRGIILVVRRIDKLGN